MKISLVFALAALPTGPLFANGGGYFRGGVERVGDVVGFEPQATENIRILDEKLTIALGPSEADVEVRYLMQNETRQRVKVRFGFPVEESAHRTRAGELRLPDQLRYCRNYQITVAGAPVKVTWQAEQPATDRRFIGIAGWLISELTFSPGEEKPVWIGFQSGYPLSARFVSDDGFINPRIFKYRLSTAACWAGTIGTGRIMLKPNGIPPEELKVIKPVNRFRKEGDNWVWDFQDLEPTLADDLEIEVTPQVSTYGGTYGENDFESLPVTYIERNGRWTMAHKNYSITASSTLPPDEKFKYDAENVKEWGRGVWSEGSPGSGKGEWLELMPEVAKPLAAIAIVPGYAYDEELFRANARPHQITVELNSEHRFEARIADSSEEQLIRIAGYAKPVKAIRLTFGEVWEGSGFEDLCVSEINLHVRLDKKPKITPAR